MKQTFLQFCIPNRDIEKKLMWLTKPFSDYLLDRRILNEIHSTEKLLLKIFNFFPNARNDAYKMI